jgi:hypothetical protein
VKLQDFIEDLTSLELTLAYIQMDFTRNTSTINDVSAAAGLGKIFKSWNFDLSNTFCKTHLIIILKHCQCNFKRKFTYRDAGGLAFSQNTTNFDTKSLIS